MRLINLSLHNIRNFKEISFELHPQFNVFLGCNGSGKTSVLEAINLIAMGRSFRTRQLPSIIRYQTQQLTCFAKLTDLQIQTLGFEKNIALDARYKVNSEICHKLSTYAQLLPIQLITPDTFELLKGESLLRRQFLDWGVFHAEKTVFAQSYSRFTRLLKQRNAALKNNTLPTAWENELIPLAEVITKFRQKYLKELSPYLSELQSYLLPEFEINIEYQSGFHGQNFQEALEKAREFDKRVGYTSVGPHRADVTFKIDNYKAQEVLSRGQQKILICILLFAQANHLAKMQNKKCIYLIDDLAAELDSENRERILNYLNQSQHQVFLSALDKEGWPDLPANFFDLSENFSKNNFTLDKKTVVEC